MNIQSLKQESRLDQNGPYNDSLGEMLIQLGAGTAIRLKPGDVLWQEGEHADSVALLREGSLEVVSEGSGDAQTVVLRVLRPGAVLGEISCLDRGRRAASVRASTDALVTSYPAADFRALLDQRPRMLEALLIQQLETVRRLTAQVTQHHHRAITDQLTQTYNLGFFVERLSLDIERAEKMGDPLAVVMVDIDFFKRFNDSYGHQAGNRVLIRIGQILNTVGRRGDIVARYGGEEFIALLYGAGGAEAFAFAERLRRTVEAADFSLCESGDAHQVTLSAGVAVYPKDGSEVNALVRAADANLYKAKQKGRNRVVVVANGELDPGGSIGHLIGHQGRVYG
ncbi:MAG: diguanylate cyclase [Thiohalocapsa sp.]